MSEMNERSFLGLECCSRTCCPFQGTRNHILLDCFCVGFYRCSHCPPRVAIHKRNGSFFLGDWSVDQPCIEKENRIGDSGDPCGSPACSISSSSDWYIKGN